MSVYYENGELKSIRFMEESEAPRRTRLYEVGTKLLFVKAAEAVAVSIPVQIA